MNIFSKVLTNLGVGGLTGKLVAIMGIITSLIFLYTSFEGSFPAFTQRGLLLILSIPMIFLLAARKKKNSFGQWRDLIMAVISPIPFFYIMIIQNDLVLRGGIPNSLDIVMGILAVLIVIEVTRTKLGWALPILAISLILYGFFGPSMPSLIEHRGLDMGTTISALYLSEDGIFGIPLAVTSEFIIVFIIFGAFLQVTGAGDFFSSLAKATIGGVRGGPAKAAVVGSALMGTISGSAVANVATVGTITIPLMKKTGYRPEVAGGIEATGSCGGQLMPPVMGAAAFIMADFLKVSYAQVVIAAVFPAVLYYLSLFFMVDLEAAKTGLKGMSGEEIPNLKRTLLHSGHLLIPIIILIIFLGVIQYSPQKAAFLSIVALILVSFLRSHTRLNAERVFTALAQGAIGCLDVAVVCACAGIAIGIIMRTGLGFILTNVLIELSHGNLPVLMILTMVTSTILGMGLPTSACYIIVAVLIAPAMIKMGVVPMAAHMFSFYYATLSAITPPVALAAYAAAGIAKSPPMITGFQASRFGLTGFIVPFMFVYGPELLLMGSVTNIIIACITAVIGVYAISISLIGWIFTKVPVWGRVACLASAILLIKPGFQTDVLGFAVLAAVGVVNYLYRRRERSRSEVKNTI
ncbi:MAG: Sialic acid TRAP transporter permease protein SiaT [Smithella sp. PtaU1.Bin162]|nr:MAG: Sialic acid TRAP transporter permease protein SiaT [Smithella sp. PtaU1.Bin162]